jgi:hypothetical protein
MPSKMFIGRTRPLARCFATALLAASALCSTSALAQTAPSEISTVNLIRALVRKGVLAQDEADTMIAQAEAEAAQARASAQAAQGAAPSAPGTSVRYVPQFVRDEIKQEVRTEILADARTQGLVAPDILPAWVRGVTLSGDLRVRDEGRFFDKRNAADFMNIAAINNGSPYNTDKVSYPFYPALLNTLKDRNFLRLRARLGLEARIDKDLTATFRLATGSDNSPISTNQTLGGFFSKKSIWLDRAYVDFHPVEGGHVLIGRMPNLFRMPELVWDDDINLDGIAASYDRALGGGLSAYAAGGAFPLDYIPDDFPTTAPAWKKIGSSENKWLFAGQIGAAWQATDALRAGVNIAYYEYSKVEGDISPSCANTEQYCFTDQRRATFAQKGNTVFALRDNYYVDPANQASPQYYGIASAFRVLALGAEVDWAVDEGVHLNVAGHWSKNLAYDEARILARGFNAESGQSQIISNNESCSVALVGGACPAGKAIFKSGGDAWLIRATIGRPKIEKFGDWSLTGSYRHIEPDALFDAFIDSDFRLGGTNAKGWTVGGSLGLRKNTRFSIRWLNGEEIWGPPLRVNVMQADLNVKF